MGWTYYHAPTDCKGRVNRKAECDKISTWERRDEQTGELISSGRVLKSRMVGSTYYAAVELKGRAHPVPHVGCFVFLTHGKAHKYDYMNFGYKDMDETCEPYYYDCPESILALLSPTDNENALKWRAACHERNAAKKADALENFDAPKCMEVSKRKGSPCYVVTSRYYRSRNPYSGVRYGRGIKKRDAVTRFWERHCPLMRFSANNRAFKKCLNACA